MAFFSRSAISSSFIRLAASFKLVVGGPGFTPSLAARPAMIVSASARAFASGVGPGGGVKGLGVGFTGFRGVFGGCDFFIKLCGYSCCVEYYSKTIYIRVNAISQVSDVRFDRFGNPISAIPDKRFLAGGGGAGCPYVAPVRALRLLWRG